MRFKLIVFPSALKDVQKAIDYYDNKAIGLGQTFVNELNSYLLYLQKNPFFQIRYKTIRCLPLKKFPFMIHFTINEKTSTIYIRAILHTSLNPNSNWH